jgi:hypothetical protein
MSYPPAPYVYLAAAFAACAVAWSLWAWRDTAKPSKVIRFEEIKWSRKD